MKRIFLYILITFIGRYAFGQTGNKIIIGTIDSVHSKILNEQRKIWVHVPYNDLNNPAARQRYPVVYLLDGDAHFTSVVGMLQQLGTVTGNSICPDMIVVGIPNTARTRDLTPTKDSIDLSSGGGKQFMDFIGKELMPYIESTYPTQPYRMLVGHSLGGLAVMDALINHTQLFHSYISIDPSMWWNNQHLLQTAKKVLTQKKFSGRKLYVGIANTLEKDMRVADVVKDTTRETLHIRSILEMDSIIKSHKSTGLKYASKYYEYESHSSVPLIAQYDAFHFIFDKYSLKLNGKDFTDSTVDLAKKYNIHFELLSQELGYAVKPAEEEINSMGYQFLRMKQNKKSESMFTMNIKNYPESPNVYDSYGDYLIAIGEKQKAIGQLKFALSIKENSETRKKLNKLLE